MTDTGRSRHFERVAGMLALPPIATELLRYGTRRFGPEGDIPAWFKMKEAAKLRRPKTKKQRRQHIFLLTYVVAVRKRVRSPITSIATPVSTAAAKQQH